MPGIDELHRGYVRLSLSSPSPIAPIASLQSDRLRPSRSESPPRRGDKRKNGGTVNEAISKTIHNDNIFPYSLRTLRSSSKAINVSPLVSLDLFQKVRPPEGKQEQNLAFTILGRTFRMIRNAVLLPAFWS